MGIALEGDKLARGNAVHDKEAVKIGLCDVKIS